MGGLVSTFGNAVAVSKQSGDYRNFGTRQEKKADEFTQKANQVVTQQVTNDPAYMLKEYLANNGMPGLQQYLENIDANTANQIAVGEKSASSGGGLMAYLASVYGGNDLQKNKLYSDSALFEANNKSNLADTRYTWQTNYDTLARNERNKLNKVASQYQAAADTNIEEANKMDSALIGSTFSSMGGMMNGA